MMRFQRTILFLFCVGMLSFLASVAYGDFNWPIAPPSDATTPGQPKPKKPGDRQKDPECKRGSTIECQNQILGERLSVTGTPYTLNYRSDRVFGRKASYSVDIPLSGSSVPASLRSILLEISIAGQKFTQTFPPTPNQTTSFTWDGKDAYGRPVQGQQPITVRTGFVYQAVFATPAQQQQAFAAYGSSLTASRARQEITLWQDWLDVIGSWDARAEGLGGWSLSVHHAYDPTGRVLYLGTGDQRVASQIYNVITTVAGNGVHSFSGDGGPATQATLKEPIDVATGPDGSLYIADMNNYRIRRVGPDGVITTVFDGSNSAMQIQTLALGPDSSIYFPTNSFQLMKRSPDGTLSIIAGHGGATGFSGDGGPATQALLGNVTAMAVGPDGSVYFSELHPDGSRVRRIGPDGVITTIAGNGTTAFSGDGGPANQAGLDNVSGIGLSPDGSLYLSDGFQFRIRRVGPDGIITTVAGSGSSGFSGDGGPAIQATLRPNGKLAIGRDGSLYIADLGNARVRRVGPDGIITTVAGSGDFFHSSGDGGLATQAGVTPWSAAVSPDGSLYIADATYHRIRRVTAPLPGFSDIDILVPSEDGGELYEFDNSGKHLRTMDTFTGALRYQFSYDTAGRLSSITDLSGNITAIERDVNGSPTGILGPFGQRTTVTVDANNFLASVKNPANEAVGLASTTDGLLTSLTDPKAGVHSFSYDSLGRLAQDTDPAGGFSALSRVDGATDYTVSLTTALNRTNTYQVQNLSTGDIQRVNTDQNGFQTTELIKTDGTRKTTSPDGTVTTLLQGPDPRFGMQTPLPLSFKVATPSGLLFTETTTRVTTLVNPNDPLSLLTQRDTVKINGQDYTSLYDKALKLVTITTPGGRQSVTQIDNKGRITNQQVTGINALSYSYDSAGRLATVTQGTRASSLSYNSQGFVSSITDPLSRSISFLYDSSGRVVQQTLPDGRVIGYTYDSNGNVTSVTPPGRPTHLMTYTAVDLEQAYTPPDVGMGSTATQYTYNLDKQLTQVARPDGQTMTFGYDTGGRLSTLTIPGGALQYAYSPTTGNLSTVTAPNGGTLSYTYDGSLPKSATWAGAVSGSVEGNYDNNFRLISQTVNGATSISFGYDVDGLLNSAGGLSIGRSAQNGLITGTTLSSVTDSRSYSTFGEIGQYTASVSGSPVLDDVYTRDNLGRITQKVETVSGVTHTYVYSYDTAGRLTDVTDNGAAISHYGYDANSNRTTLTTPSGTISGSYDTQDRMLSYGTNTYTYTTNGELQSKTDATANQTTQYTYDVLGNLTNVILPNGNQVNYVMDGQNRRIGKKVNGVLVQGFLYQNQLKPIAELDGSNNVITRFVYGTKANVPDYMIRGGITYRIISDHLGSPRFVINASTGSVLQLLAYDEFGKIILDTNPGFQPFGFAGGIYDQDTKLTRFGARDYDAEIGRWTAKDPIQFAGGATNLYGYVISDPLNLADPSGRLAAAGALIGAGIDLGVQLYLNGGDIQNINWISVAASALSGAAGVGLGTAVAGLTSSVAAQLALNAIGSAGIGALSTLAQNYLRGGACSLTANALQNAAISGVLGGLGSGVGQLGSALDTVAANNAWNAASLSDKLSAISNAFLMTPSSESSLLVGIGNALGVTVSNSGPLLQ